MEKENGLPIITIYVKPRNQRYCNYQINDNQIHTKTYEELSIYLCSLLPEQSTEINRLIGFKKHFIIFLQEKKIQELKFDFYAEMKDLSIKMKHENIQIIQNKERQKLNQDDYIKGISRKDISKRILKRMF